MIIQCDKCQSKFKIDDSKVTEKGVKVKCKKCSNIFTVYPPKEEKITSQLFEETLQQEQKEEPKKEDVSFELPSFEFSISEKKEEKTEVKEEPKDEFSWDQFNIDISEKKEEDKEKTEEEFKLDFDSLGEAKEQVKEESKDEKPEFDLNFDFDKLASQEKKDEELKTDEDKTSIEEFIKEDLETQKTFDFSFEEKKEEEQSKVMEKEEESFSFDSFQFEEEKKDETSRENEEKSILDEFNFEDLEKQEETFKSFDIKEEMEKEQPKEPQSFEFVFEEESSTQKIEPQEELKIEEKKESGNEELNFTFLEEESKISFPQEEFTQEKEQQTVPSAVLEETKPKSGILTIVVSLLIIILFSGTGIGFVWWQKTKILEQEGSFGITEVKAEFFESKTLGNVFVVKGKITNGYRVPKSFLKVKCVLYGKDNKKLAEKVAFASNVFTKDEIRELTYAEIEKGLNNKMGKSMMNVDVSPGKAIPFMIVFDKIPEGVSHLEVEAI